ncbi:MAG: hypothetical protein HC904_16660 [Blastochloris sp.]|nr:hypothetical protein [Blastochloris sp.]
MKTLITTFIAIACAVSAQAKPFYTNYVVPNGYRGPLVMIIHPEKGLELPPLPSTWDFIFNSHGKITVKRSTYKPPHSSQGQMENHAGPRARYEDGTVIPMEGTVADDEIAFRSVYGVGPNTETGETSVGAIYFFVGTLEEAKRFELNQKKKQS